MFFILIPTERMLTMSKERLEEENNFDVEREMKHLKGVVEKDDSLIISSRFVKYLIQQAERVQELEEDLRLSEEEEDKRWKQNKRYREAIERTLSNARHCMDNGLPMYPSGIMRSMSQALEESE